MRAAFCVVFLWLFSCAFAVPHISTSLLWRHSTRAIPGGWSSLGCVADGDARALSAYTFSSNSLTQESCIAGCAAAGYGYAGMEYHSQCFCADSFSDGFGTFTDSLQCNTPCSGMPEPPHEIEYSLAHIPSSGNSAQTCGGSWRLSVFSSLPSGWSLARSCAVDTSARILSSYSILMNNNSPITCIRICALKGYSMAGVEYGDECRCGNSWNGGAPAIASDSECAMPCVGDTSQKCGGAWRIRVYASGSASLDPTTTSSNPSATATAASLPSGWQVTMACAVDVPSRVLSSYLIILSLNTPSACISTCAAKGYSYSGVQYGNECYCANDYNGGGTPDSAPASDCVFPCAGDSSQTCGG